MIRHLRKAQRGFSIIEVMIAVTIVSILSAFAIPSYSEYIRRGHRADARAALLQAQQWLERSSTATGVYPTALPNALQWRLADGTPDPTKRYTIGFQAGNTNARFTLAATRKAGPQETDRCGDFTITNTGVREAINKTSGATTTECWNR